MIGRAGLWLTPEQIAAGLTIPTTTPPPPSGDAKSPLLSTTSLPALGIPLWVVVGLWAFLLWRVLKK